MNLSKDEVRMKTCVVSILKRTLSSNQTRNYSSQMIKEELDQEGGDRYNS